MKQFPESKLRVDCGHCSGLCCVALCFMKSDGFPADKPAGKPCTNLLPDFRCTIHAQLDSLNMKGCLSYDCFGAGQKVTRDCYPDSSWRTSPELAGEIFDVFLIMVRMHQMLWYLLQAVSLVGEEPLRLELQALILENEEMTTGSPVGILALDVESYRKRVNKALRSVCGITGQEKVVRDFIGKDFKKRNLEGRDFSMSLLIGADLSGCSLGGANFLGADMRDVNIRNADLRESLFLTQMQVNSTIGDSSTMLPSNICRPAVWARTGPDHNSMRRKQ